MAWLESCDVVRVNFAQKQWHDQFVEDEAAMAPAVARAQSGDADKAADDLMINRPDKARNGGGKQRHLAKRAYRRTKCANDRGAALKRTRQGILLTGIAFHQLGTG